MRGNPRGFIGQNPRMARGNGAPRGRRVEILPNYPSNTTNASSLYEKWNFTRKVKEEQRPILAGYFHRGSGENINISGEFRHYGDYLTNFGVSYVLNGNELSYNKFLKQRLEKASWEQNLLGLSMSRIFENETAQQSLTMNGNSYFYLERIRSI